MATQKQIEERRRKVEDLQRKGWSGQEIADELGWHYNTIYNDLDYLNKRYKKWLADHPEYLERRQEKILRFLDDFNALKKEYFDLKDTTDSDDKKLKALDSIRKTIVEQARILKLIGGQNKYLQQNYIHIDKINESTQELFEAVEDIIDNFVPEGEQEKAYKRLKSRLKKSSIKEVGDEEVIDVGGGD